MDDFTIEEKKDQMIIKATNPATITLTTATFGRDTDFEIIETITNELGMHAILAFLPNTMSELRSIKGRVAR